MRVLLPPRRVVHVVPLVEDCTCSALSGSTWPTKDRHDTDGAPEPRSIRIALWYIAPARTRVSRATSKVDIVPAFVTGNAGTAVPMLRE